jgi:endonuclease/exonuclease/phosphatase (EEP) superfamily protein YafD
MKTLLPILLVSITFYSRTLLGASSFFAKDLIRGLFDIEVIEEEKVVSKIQYQKKPSTQFLLKKEKILIWNLYKGELFKKSPLPIQFEDYALIFFQEFSENIPHQFRPKLNSYFLPTFKWDKAPTGVAIFTNYIAEEVIPLHTKYREPFILTPKSSLIMTVNDITVINTHALNFVSDEEWQFELQEILKLIKNKPKVIWAGDFNTWDSMRTLYLSKIMDDHQFKAITFKNDQRSLHLGHPVDHIFLKGLIGENPKTIKASDFSDHNPMMIEIKSN